MGARSPVDLACVTLIAALVACSPYQPDSLLTTYPSAAKTVGCLDVAVQPLADSKAEGPAAKIFVANRCNTRVFVDYPAIRASIKYTDERFDKAFVHDPHQTLKPVALDARSQGWEAFEYHTVDLLDGDAIAASLCLDISALDRVQPSTTPIDICVRAENNRTVFVEEIL